jgi:glucosamine--fructose-6-phosphate aminotransferase (isomerizing)
LLLKITHRLTEQPEAIARALGYGGRLSSDKVFLGGLDTNFEKLSKIKFMTLSACGTSLNAAIYAEKIMKMLESFDHVVSLDAAETSEKDFPKTNTKSAGLIVVSQSGETKDVHRVVKAAMSSDITVLSVVNAVGSLIARTSGLGVYCNAGRENAVASTKAFTTQVTVLALVALWFRGMRDTIEGGNNGPSYEAKQLQEALMRLPISFGMAMQSRDQCKQVAERLNSKEHCFILGKGKSHKLGISAYFNQTLISQIFHECRIWRASCL